MPFLDKELTARGIHLDTCKTVALAPKGHVPTPEERSLLAGVSVRIADEGGIKVVGVLHRYKLALRERQATRRGREEEGRLMPMAWGCHIDVTSGIIRVGLKKASKGLAIFCLEWGRKLV